MHWLTWTTFAGALALALVSTRARADAVPPPPNDCPAGSQGETCHGSPYCQPAACKTDADCTTGQTCAVVSLCISMTSCFGSVAPPDGGSNTIPEQNVVGPCNADGTCDGVGGGGASCTPVRVCATPGDTTINGTACGCRTVGDAGTALPFAVLGVGAMAAGLRARSRSRARGGPR
jgi:hypothetical protein